MLMQEVVAADGVAATCRSKLGSRSAFRNEDVACICDANGSQESKNARGTGALLLRTNGQ